MGEVKPKHVWLNSALKVGSSYALLAKAELLPQRRPLSRPAPPTIPMSRSQLRSEIPAVKMEERETEGDNEIDTCVADHEIAGNGDV